MLRVYLALLGAGQKFYEQLGDARPGRQSG